MEQKVFSKFNIYDQIGYLMVGAVAILVVIFDTLYFYLTDIPTFSLDNFLVWLIVAYFAGHLIQGIANIISSIPLLRRLIRENRDDFSDQEKEILEEAKNYFGLDKQDNNKLWNLCYVFATAKDITGQVQSFNAYYSLYRGWLVIFILEAMLFISNSLFAFTNEKLVLFLISTFLSVVFYRRSKRFWRYTRNKVFETFVVVKTLKL